MRRTAAHSMSMAWDGHQILYVSDAYNRRITVYSIGAIAIPYTRPPPGQPGYSGTRNPDIAGTIQAGDVITINIGGHPATDSAELTLPAARTISIRSPRTIR